MLVKTPALSQQIEALRRLNGKKYFALFMEQGTGKSYTLLADAERLYSAGKIDAVVVVAPTGVHINWVRREIPKHLDDPYIARAWSTNMSKRARRAMDDLMNVVDRKEQVPLRILAVSYDSLCTKEGFDFTASFMNCTRSLFILDESHYIKNMRAARTKQCFRLKERAIARRISTGTPMDMPGDIFSQMEFLRDGLLGTSSYRAFFSEFAQLANHENPVTDSDWAYRRQVKNNPRLAHAIIVARDDTTGQPIYRNLDKLNKLLDPYSYRVLKKDCLDLPEKVYQTVYFELTPAQRAAYDLMEDELRIQCADGTIHPVNALASLVKLQQITSGFVKVPGREELEYIGCNARLDALRVATEPLGGRKIIVWARFQEEIKDVANALRDMGRKVVEYHGLIKKGDRETAIDTFEEGDADAFVGNPQAGGLGLTLVAGAYAIYYSNYYSTLIRKQSEDRNHRIGTGKDFGGYIDLCAVDSIDESIAKAHQWKSDLAATILGDRRIDVRSAISPTIEV